MSTCFVVHRGVMLAGAIFTSTCVKSVPPPVVIRRSVQPVPGPEFQHREEEHSCPFIDYGVGVASAGLLAQHINTWL